MQGLESLTGNVGVNRCRRYVGMTQQHLYGPQIGPMVEQMRRKSVA